ncbi:MAG: hypothetical protein QOI29_4848 [Mycobacterium sp.]|nr:hypothetical protein [Mycobacterium sp.]
MTTPPTPAGWYPDPDGSGGQRYWDGSQWTEHRSPAAPEPTEPPPPAEPPASEQPTTVVPLRPGGEHVGAHRAPESEPEPVAPPGPEPGPTAVIPTFEPVPVPTAEPEPTPGPEPGPTAVINLGSSMPSAHATTPMASPPPPPVEPSVASAPFEPPPPGEPPAPDDRRKLLIWFGSACAALLAVLVLVIIYGLFINKPETTSISDGPSSTSKSAIPTTSTKSSTESTSESPTTASGSGPQASDGGLTFAITGTETASSVKYQDAPVEKTAQGEFIVVHMTVLNSGDAQGTFLATLQKLNAGGTTYSIDDEATAYLNGTWADLAAPGDTADVAIAFDVPPGTTPESLEVHGAPMSTGVQVPLS